jgi:hypothetical protein
MSHSDSTPHHPHEQDEVFDPIVSDLRRASERLAQSSVRMSHIVEEFRIEKSGSQGMVK